MKERVISSWESPTRLMSVGLYDDIVGHIDINAICPALACVCLNEGSARWRDRGPNQSVVLYKHQDWPCPTGPHCRSIMKVSSESRQIARDEESTRKAARPPKRYISDLLQDIT
jgi:hypothetical protein